MYTGVCGVMNNSTLLNIYQLIKKNTVMDNSCQSHTTLYLYLQWRLYHNSYSDEVIYMTFLPGMLEVGSMVVIRLTPIDPWVR